MMSTTGLLCLVAALVSTVSCAINCTQCENRNGTECDSPTNVSCPYGCATVSEYCNAQCRPVPSIQRGCADQTLTAPITIGYSDRGQLRVQVHAVPCFEDGCNKNAPYRYNPEDLGPPKSLYCESCFVENCVVNYCNSSDRVQCREGQTKCLSFSGKFERGNGAIVNYASKGCVNPVVCVVKFKALFATKALVERSFECTDATQNERDCSGCGGNSYY